MYVRVEAELCYKVVLKCPCITDEALSWHCKVSSITDLNFGL